MRFFSSAIILLACMLLMCYINWTTITQTVSRRRSLQQQPPEPLRSKELLQVLQTQGPNISKLIRESASTYFCPESQEVLWQHYPPLNYEDCPDNSTFYAFPTLGGMTNSLKFMILGALMSVEDGRCFIGSNGVTRQYFQPIGLRYTHRLYTNAIHSHSMRRIFWQTTWNDERLRRVERHEYDFTNVTTFGYSHPDPHVNGISLKRDFIRRLWQLKPEIRESTCQSLQNDHHNLLQKDYIAFSVRRGDKASEGFRFPSMLEYIHAAEPIIEANGVENKTIFVATDDCKVLNELRHMRPDWDFESQCDYLQDNTNNEGFVLTKLNHLTSTQRDAHFQKFFTEIYALAMSKVFSKYQRVYCY